MIKQNKLLVVFFSKHGTTLQTAKLIKEECGNGCNITNVQNLTNTLSDYQFIVIGSPIIAGKLPKPIVRFIHNNEDLLLKRRVFIYIHGLISRNNYMEILRSNINNPLFDHIEMKVFLGGKLDLMECNFALRMILKKIAQKNGIDPNNLNTLDKKEIGRFLTTIKQRDEGSITE